MDFPVSPQRRQMNHPPKSSATSTTSSITGIDSTSARLETHNERTTLLESEEGEHYGSVESAAAHNTLRKKIKYYIPAFAWVPYYSLSLFGGDVLAGLTVASMLIPQSVSYATSLANLSPVTGLYAASIPGIIYALLGTSRQLNVAPEAALSLLVGQAVSAIKHELGDPDGPESDALGMAVATIITLQVGLISFLLGFFRLGFIDVVLSRALLRGFITAIAVVITIEQIIPMFGLVALEHKLEPHTTFDKFLFVIENITHAHRPTAIISSSALLILVFLRYSKVYFKKYWFIYRVPEVLVVVVVSTFLSARYEWDTKGVAILGSVPIQTGGSFFKFPINSKTLPFLRTTTSTAVLISIAGFLDSIVAAKQNGARFGHTISPNRELVALGAANLVGSFVPGTLPAYGSITRSRINGDVGGRTQMASLVCSGIVLLAIWYLLPWLYYLPKSVLASVICLVVVSLIAETPHDVAYYIKMQAWVDLTLMTLTFLFSIIWNVEAGILVSLVISLLLVVHRSSKTRMTILGRIPGTEKWKPINENPEAEEDVAGVLIVRLRENLDFANTAQLKERLRRLELYGIERSHPSEEPRRKQATCLIFHLADVEQCDASAVQIFHELLTDYQSRGVGLFMTHLRPGPRQRFADGGIVALLGPQYFYDTVAEAVAHVETIRRHDQEVPEHDSLVV